MFFMFDWIRNLGKSAEEKRQEALTAYLDNALTPAQRQAFERELAQDAGLRETMEQQRLLKAQLHQLPRVAAPRNFTLDPAVYGQQRPATTMRSYTVLRTATALVAFFFVLALVVDWGSRFDSLQTVAMNESAPVAEQSSGGVVTESDEVQAEAEPAEEDLAQDVQEEAAEEVELETANDAPDEAGEADGYTTPFTLATPTPEPTVMVNGADAQPESPGLAAPESTEAIAPVPAAGGIPRPTSTPPLTGRDVVATIEPPLLYSVTVDTVAVTPMPTIIPIAEFDEPVSTFRIVEFALGGLFLVLLTLTLLTRRRGLS